MLYNKNVYDEGLDKKRYLAFRFFIDSIPILVDISLTILLYNKDYKTYYIIRYLTQILDIFCCFMFAWFISFSIVFEEDDAGNYFAICSAFSLPFLVIIKEIPSLIFFIKYFDNLVLLSKISYFIHYISSLIIIIIYIIFSKNKKN